MVSLAVLYNIVFVIGRAVFWEINRQAPALWWTLDYLCDFIYLADTLVHCHEGKYRKYNEEKINEQTNEGRQENCCWVPTYVSMV